MSILPIHIDSPDDPRIEVFRDVRDRDLRGRHHLFMAESERVIERLLDQPDRVHSILLLPERWVRIQPLLNKRHAAIPVYVAAMEVMRAIAGFDIHRGVLAAGVRPHANETTLDAALGHLKTKTPLRLLIAEDLNNVDNLGGLFRNAAAFGVDAIILSPQCCDPLYRKAIRVSMGHVLSTPWAIANDWPADLERLRTEWGVTIFAAETGDDALPISRMPTPDRLAILVGAENRGVSEAALKSCDGRYEIPMAANTPSLNVVVAAAIFLHHAQTSSQTGSIPDLSEPPTHPS